MGGLGIGAIFGLQAQEPVWALDRFSVKEGLPTNHVTALAQTRDHFLWVGTPGGIARFDGRRFVVTPREAFAGAGPGFTPFAFAGESGTNFWVASSEGVFQRWDDGHFIRLDFGDPAEASSIRTLIPRRNVGRSSQQLGEIWVGTDRGLFELRTGKLQTPWKSPFTEPVWRLAESASGMGGGLVVSAASGLWLQHADNTWQTLVGAKTAVSDCSPALASDGASLWVADRNGASALVGSQGKLVKLKGIGPGCYRFAAAGIDNALWLAEAEAGLYRRSAEGVVRIPGTSRSEIGRIAALSVDSLNRVWLGTDWGLYCVRALNEPPAGPPLVSLDLLHWGETTVALAAPRLERLRHPAKTAGDVRFEFAAPLLVPADGVRFASRVSGDEPGVWQEGETPVATFRNLSPGRYVLEVRARSGQGAWSSSVTLPFELEPTFVQSPAFRLLAVILGSGMLAASAWWRLRWRARHRSGRSQHLLASERERIARDLHDEIGSHLAALALQAESLKRKADPALASDLDRLAGEVRATAGRMSDIVWELNPACDTIASFGSYLIAHTDEWARLTGTRVRVEAPPELPAERMSPKARRHLALVVREAFVNVAKHSGATEAKLLIRYGPDDLFLSVQDNGRGFDPAEAGSTPVGATNNGVRNQRRRIEELGGTLDLRSRYGGGTRLDITVPLSALTAK